MSKKNIWKQSFQGSPYNKCSWDVFLRSLPGGSFPVKLQAVGLSFQQKWDLPQVFLKDFDFFLLFFVLLMTVFGNCSQWLLQYFKSTFDFNLKAKEIFLEKTLRGWSFYNYPVLHQLFIEYQLCIDNPERLSPQMSTNLLRQRFFSFAIVSNIGYFSR